MRILSYFFVALFLVHTTSAVHGQTSNQNISPYFAQSHRIYEALETIEKALKSGQTPEALQPQLITLDQAITQHAAIPFTEVGLNIGATKKWTFGKLESIDYKIIFDAVKKVLGEEKRSSFARHTLTLVARLIDNYTELEESPGRPFYVATALNEIFKKPSQIQSWLLNQHPAHLCHPKGEVFGIVQCDLDSALAYYLRVGKLPVALEWAKLRVQAAKPNALKTPEVYMQALVDLLGLEIRIGTRKNAKFVVDDVDDFIKTSFVSGELYNKFINLKQRVEDSEGAKNHNQNLDQLIKDILTFESRNISSIPTTEPERINNIYRLAAAGKLTAQQQIAFQENLKTYKPRFLKAIEEKLRFNRFPGCRPFVEAWQRHSVDSGPELWELKNRLFKTQRHICPPLAHLSAVDAQATMNGTVSFSLFGFDEAFINVEPASSLKIAIEGGLLINNRGFGDEINFNGFWDGRSRELWPFRAEVENAPSVLEFMLVTIRQFHKDGQVQNAFNALTHLNHLAETWMTQNWTRNGAALGGDQGRVKSVLRQSLQYWMLLSSQQQALKDKPLFAEAFKAAQLAQLGDVSLAIQAGLRQSITANAKTRLLVEELEEKAHAVEHYKSVRDTLSETPITDGFDLAVSKAQAKLEVAQINVRELLPIIEQYSEIAPVSIEQIKAKLKPGEAFLFFVPVGNGTAAFFSTSTTSAFYSVGIPAAQMNASIEALRKGLDPENVTKGLHDFDPVLAHTLYQHLFGPLAKIAGSVKHFLVVAEGGLASLPLQVLLKSPPTKDAQGFLDLRNLDWFVKHHAVTTLTSPRNMIAQGQRSSLGTPKQPMIGFGDPVFKNGQTHIDQNQNTGSSLRAIRPNQLLPLPETRDELKHVAKITKARDSDLFFGDAASEKVIKSLNKANRLSDYSILYFATHGALPGELDGFLEPGLVLTQPSRLTAEDDGYLSASEIASLRLNADWVVLSACNTAGEGKAGNQSLSGLAKAFFKAGAKSLLVSHWEVISTAAVELTGETFKALASQETTSRAEALRLAMIRVMNDRSNSAKAHPAYWAPFAVVGASS